MSKLKIASVVVVGFVLLIMLTRCSKSPDQKVADAKADVVKANQDVKDAVAGVTQREDWLKFKNESDALITANENIITNYKVKMTAANGKLRAKYDKNIDELEKKNKALKVKLDDYVDGGKTTWEQFKSEFNHDMTALGTALKDFTVDNKK